MNSDVIIQMIIYSNDNNNYNDKGYDNHYQ